MSNYISIVRSSLIENTKVGCDLYLRNRVNGTLKYVLFCRGDAIFSEERRGKLIEQNIENLFIRAGDYKDYFKYQEENLQAILTDEKKSPKEKSYIVYNAAKYLVQDLLRDPRSGANIKRAKEWVNNTVEYILNDENAVSNLLRVTSYDYYTYTHSVGVSVLALLFSKHISLDTHDMNCLGAGALLHDLGKVRIPLRILNKPGKLDKNEFQIVKQHPQIGMDFLAGKKEIDEKSLKVVIQHHENYDGSGYPNKIGFKDIHLFGKIARIVDVYDAITTTRCYGKARTPYEAIVEMHEKMKNYFEKELLEEFVCFLEPYSIDRK
jgi:HD-GYP domain-containing protein (c-di-GMP phosphodiesterase class II)